MTSTYATAATPHEQARAAVADLYRFLETSGDLANWRQYLHDGQLQAQLAKGEKADPNGVIEVLGRFGAGAKELDSAPFVKTRRALAEWLASLPAPSPEQLPAAARAAKSAFLAPTEADLQISKAELLAALGRLDARLKVGGERGRGWATYLKLDKVQEQFAGDKKPDLTVLDAAYLTLASGHEGLNLVWFADARRAVRNYVTTARLIGRADFRNQYHAKLDELAQNLDKYQKTPSAETSEAINFSTEWLQRAGQAKWLVRAIRQRLSHPNVHVEVSRSLIAARLAGPIDETTPVRDCILGTDVHGTGHATGQLGAELIPSEDAGQLEIVFRGQIASDAVGYNGPVQIFSTGTTQLEARKRLSLTPERIVGSPAVSQADTSTTIDAIESNRGSAMIERFAWKRAGKQKGQAEYIASRHAEELFNQRMDKQADDLIGKANETLVKKVRRPLLERNLFPEFFQFRTTGNALFVTLTEAPGGSLAAPGAPPTVAEPGDLSVQVHQSAINNFTTAALGGLILDRNRFYELLEEYVGPVELGPGVKDDDDKWSITFAPRQPIAAVFDEGRFVVTIRGQEFFADGETHPAMNISAVYAIQKTDRGFKALRQGKLKVLPPDFDPDSGEQLPPRLQMLATMLERRFGKFFTEELTPKNLVLAGEGREPTELELTRWETGRGWLVLGWKQVAK